ncbi:MAG: PLP-dependent transferase [Pirellulaceae bacterium]|nr:PLP-dependent transferase [Pirellulaceae bacterium]
MQPSKPQPKLCESSKSVHTANINQVFSEKLQQSKTPENRQKFGLSDSMIRIAAGIENSADLLADLEQALAQA